MTAGASHLLPKDGDFKGVLAVIRSFHLPAGGNSDSRSYSRS
jgi:hypothetical protein